MFTQKVSKHSDWRSSDSRRRSHRPSNRAGESSAFALEPGVYHPEYYGVPIRRDSTRYQEPHTSLGYRDQQELQFQHQPSQGLQGFQGPVWGSHASERQDWSSGQQVLMPEHRNRNLGGFGTTFSTSQVVGPSAGDQHREKRVFPWQQGAEEIQAPFSGTDWYVNVTSFWIDPVGAIRLFKTNDPLVTWREVCDIRTGMYVVVPAKTFPALQRSLAPDRAAIDEMTILDYSNPYYFQVVSSTTDSSGSWFTMELAKPHSDKPDEIPLFPRRTVKVAAGAPRMLTLTPHGASIAIEPADVAAGSSKSQTGKSSSYENGLNGRDAVRNVPSGMDTRYPTSSSSQPPPTTQVVFKTSPKVAPGTRIPGPADFPIEGISSDDESSVASSAHGAYDWNYWFSGGDPVDPDPSNMYIRCPTNGQVSVTKRHATYDQQVFEENLRLSCAARNILSPAHAKMVINDKDLSLKSDATIKKKVLTEGGRRATTDGAINQNFTALQALPLFTDASYMGKFYGPFFAVQEGRSTVIDPEGFMLAYLHPQFEPKAHDPLTFFDADPTSLVEVQTARDRVMTAVANLKRACTYLMWDAYEPLMDRIIETTTARLVPDFMFPASYVMYHLHVKLAAFTTNARLEETPVRWHEIHLQMMFDKLVAAPFEHEHLSQVFYTTLSHQLTAPPIGGGGRSQTPKRVREQKQKTKTKQESKKAKADSKSTTSSTDTSASSTVLVVASKPSTPPPPPPVSDRYCRTHLMEKLQLAHFSRGAYVCARNDCKTDPALHTRITVDATSTKKEIEDFMATPLSVTTWDTDPNRGTKLQKKQILEFAAKQP